jgi:glycosyltransferase involved in cell wall biosynthesis
VRETLYDARWIGNHGIGRFAEELAKSLPDLCLFDRKRRPWHPLDPALLGFELWRERPKLFFSPGYNSPLGWPKPFIFTLHDLNHLCVREGSNALKRAYYQQVIRPACRRAAFVLTVSEYSKREIIAWSGADKQRIVNVANGVGDPFKANGPKYEPGYPYLLYVGSHKPHKNLHRLLEAYSASGISSDVRFVMTGKPSSALNAEIQSLDLETKVYFVGTMENELLAKLYRGALGFIFPSLYEGFGLPPLEAMACGVPVLTSNVCSLPEVIGDAGMLVDPLDIDEIAMSIRMLVENTDLRRTLRQKGLRRVQEFTWKETARKTAEVLRTALAAN